ETGWIAKERGYADQEVALQRATLRAVALQKPGVLFETAGIAQRQASQDAAVYGLLTVQGEINARGVAHDRKDSAEPIFGHLLEFRLTRHEKGVPGNTRHLSGNAF